MFSACGLSSIYAWAGLERCLRENIAPLLGAVALAKLKPEQVSEAYAKALATGRRKGAGGLSPRTVRQMHAILKSALAQAVRWEICAIELWR